MGDLAWRVDRNYLRMGTIEPNGGARPLLVSRTTPKEHHDRPEGRL